MGEGDRVMVKATGTTGTVEAVEFLEENDGEFPTVLVTHDDGSFAGYDASELMTMGGWI